MSAARRLSLLVCVLSPLSLAADELPPRAVARIGDYRFYHGPGIECAVLSPDGSRIASAARYPSYFKYVSGKDFDAYDQVIVLWDAATGKRVRELRVPIGPQCLAFTPDGKRLAASCRLTKDGPGVLLFDVESGKLLERPRSFGEGARRIYFSKDGKQLYEPEAAWDVETGKELRSWKRPEGEAWVKKGERVTDSIPSPDGKFVAWLIEELPDYSKLPPGAFPPPPVTHLTALVMTDTSAEKPLYRKVFDGHYLEPGIFSPDGKRFMTRGPKFTAWDSATGKELFTLDAEKTWRFALSPDGKRAVLADSASRVRLWDLDSRKLVHDLYPGLAHISSDVLDAQQVFSADGKTLLLATDTTIRLFDLTTGKERAVPGHRTPVSVSFSAGGRTLLTACKEAECSWDVSSGKEPTMLSRQPRQGKNRSDDEWTLAHSDDGRYFVDHSGAGQRLRETATGRVVHRLTDEVFVYVALFSPDGSRVVLWHEPDHGKPEFLRFYDTRTGKAVGDVKLVNPMMRQMAYSPDGRFVAWADNANDVHLHDGTTGKLVRTLRSTQPLPKTECDDARFLFTPDGEYLIVTTYLHHWISYGEKPYTQPTRVFHVASGREVGRFYTNPDKEEDAGRQSCATCSPDGRLLAVAEEESGTIRVIEMASGKVRIDLNGHRHGVHSLAFSPDGKTLASGGEDNVVYLWDVTGARTRGDAAKDAAACWAGLADRDAARAGDCMSELVRKADAGVAFMKERLRPVAAVDGKRLARLLADLDADSFEQREAASRGLAELDELAEAALRQALKEKPPAEMKRRIEELLDKLERRPLPPEALRGVRAVEALEHIGTTEARKLLEALAKGAPEARLTCDASASLKRLEK
jgi:WD40 repeat protein